jgi:hypothetical protein
VTMFAFSRVLSSAETFGCTRAHDLVTMDGLAVKRGYNHKNCWLDNVLLKTKISKKVKIK